MTAILLAGFLKWETVTGNICLADGGEIVWGGDTYRGSHPVFGTIAGFDAITEGVGDEIPSGTLTFVPAPDADAADVNRADNQGTRIRMWIAELDLDTGAIVGTPDLQLDGIVDVTRLRAAHGSMLLQCDITSRAERLFLLNEGNVLTGEFHRLIYPAERGLDNATGVPKSVPWGTTAAPRGVS